MLAWKIRNVSVPTLNDSSLIIMAIFGAVLMPFVGLMVTSAFHFQPNVVYILSTILIAGCSSWIQAVLFLPKVCDFFMNVIDYFFLVKFLKMLEANTK